MTALTAYLTSTADSLLATANQLTNAAPSAEVNKTTKVGTVSNWIEILTQGTTATPTGLVSEPAPSGNGALWDVTTLETQTIAAGTWTPQVKMRCSGALTADIHMRAYKRSSGGVYTAIGDFVLTGQTLNSTATIYNLTTQSLSSVAFATGDKLYIDWLLNITSPAGSSAALINLYENGGNNFLTTPGYAPSSTAWTAPTTETVTVTDTPGRAVTGSRGGTETATTSDTPNRVGVFLRSIVESSIVTDLVNRVGVFGRQDGESSTATDVGTRQGAFGRQDAETTTAADSANRLAGYLRSTLEAVTSSDLVQRVLTLGRTSSESTAATDAANRQQALSRQGAESTATGDQPNRVQQFLRAVAETVQTLDNTAASVGHGATDWVVSAVESVITSDLVQRALTLGRNTPETSTAADTTARQTDLGRATQEATEAADATGRSVGALRSVDDTTTAQDAPGRIHGLMAAVNEALSSSDTLNRVGSWLRGVAEATGVLDLVSALVHRNASPGSIDITLSQPYTVAASLSQPFTVEASVTTVNTIDIAMSRG